MVGKSAPVVTFSQPSVNAECVPGVITGSDCVLVPASVHAVTFVPVIAGWLPPLLVITFVSVASHE
jgi:hypothetical protein